MRATDRSKGVECAVVAAAPWGWAGIAVTSEGVSRVVLPKTRKRDAERELEQAGCAARRAGLSARPASSLLRRAVRLLEGYFSGAAPAIDLPLDLRYYTRFQRAVWRAAAAIPRGETRSYGWIAKRIGRPKAARAVGRAMGANPVAVLVP